LDLLLQLLRRFQTDSNLAAAETLHSSCIAFVREIIDVSINETLARSTYTSATAFLAMLPMAIWGGSTVASFAVP
jgi:preprotein translocase subunit SecF